MRFEVMKSAQQWEWLRQKLSVILQADTVGLLVYDDRGNVAAGVIFDTFTRDSCNVHLAIQNPMVLRHGLLQRIAEYAYVTRGKKRIFGLVPTPNLKAIRLNKHIGFHVVTNIPDAIADGVGYTIMRLDREDCRWLEARHQMEEAA